MARAQLGVVDGVMGRDGRRSRSGWDLTHNRYCSGGERPEGQPGERQGMSDRVRRTRRALSPTPAERGLDRRPEAVEQLLPLLVGQACDRVQHHVLAASQAASTCAPSSRRSVSNP
jgi:hypothetical protein